MTPPEHLSFFSDTSLTKIADITGFDIIFNKNKGKAVNLGFLFYKLKRIFPNLVPEFILKFFKLKYVKRIFVYVPTQDIKYAVLKKV